MSSPIVSAVNVDDDGSRRTTTIVVTEGRGGVVWTATASSVPAAVRAELLDWLGAESRAADDGVHVSAGADTRLAEDAPGVTAQVGFTPSLR